MLSAEALQIFQKNRILSAASEKNIQKYFSAGSIEFCAYVGGELIYSPLSEKRRVGILLSGSANVLPVGGEDNAMLKILCPEEMFGVANLYSPELDFPSVITARTACRVLFIDGEAFSLLIENDKSALRAYLSFLNNKIGYLNKKISTLTAPTAEKKLALFLAENECGGALQGNISMSAVADMLGVGRASLYRALDSLAAEGLIIKDGKKILIPDKNALLNI